MNKHDKILKSVKMDLEDKVDCFGNKFYDSVHTNVIEYDSNRENILFEIDVLGIRNDYILLVEVKSNKHILSSKKAMYQLDREKAYLQQMFPDKRIFKMIAYGDPDPAKSYTYKWYKGGTKVDTYCPSCQTVSDFKYVGYQRGIPESGIPNMQLYNCGNCHTTIGDELSDKVKVFPKPKGVTETFKDV